MDRRWRIHETNQSPDPSTSIARACWQYFRRSKFWGVCRVQWQHFQQACQTHPSPWGATHYNHRPDETAQSRHPSYSYARDPCVYGQKDRETFRGRNILAAMYLRWLQNSWPLPNAFAIWVLLRGGCNARWTRSESLSDFPIPYQSLNCLASLLIEVR